VSGRDGRHDRDYLDFRTVLNVRQPDGLDRAAGSALAAASSYPATDDAEFRRAAAAHVSCDPPEVVPVAGRHAGIRLAVAAAVQSGAEVLVPAPGRPAYARETRLQGGDPTFCPPASLVETDPGKFGLVVACQPNDPTGEAYDPERLRAYADRCREADTPLLVDESLLGFTPLPSLAGAPGVIVVRSLGAICGLPGLRAGFLVAAGDHRDRLDTARLTWGVGTPARLIGTECMRRESFFDDTVERVRRERIRMVDRLATRFDVRPSAAPFLLVELPTAGHVDALLATLRDADILVRDARQFSGLDSHVRVTVRTAADNEALFDALGV
jgi:histidinol-phosphate aminotransferase/threonine-phosphate decarboxylase